MVTFKSDAAGNVIMFDDVARQLLEIIGKTPGKQGIVTVEQLPDAIDRLKQATSEGRAQRPPANEEEEAKLEEAPASGERKFVSLKQRAIPLIEILERSLKHKKPVTWGI